MEESSYNENEKTKKLKEELNHYKSEYDDLKKVYNLLKQKYDKLKDENDKLNIELNYCIFKYHIFSMISWVFQLYLMFFFFWKYVRMGNIFEHKLVTFYFIKSFPDLNNYLNKKYK